MAGTSRQTTPRITSERMTHHGHHGWTALCEDFQTPHAIGTTIRSRPAVTHRMPDANSPRIRGFPSKYTCSVSSAGLFGVPASDSGSCASSDTFSTRYSAIGILLDLLVCESIFSVTDG